MIADAPHRRIAGCRSAWSSRLPSTRGQAQQTRPSRSRSFVRQGAASWPAWPGPLPARRVDGRRDDQQDRHARERAGVVPVACPIGQPLAVSDGQSRIYPSGTDLGRGRPEGRL